jgi:hypothetical protein
MRDPVTLTYFGRPWFGRAQLCALGWVVGVLLGMALLEVTVAGADAPRSQPVRHARSILAQRTVRTGQPGHDLSIASVEATAPPVTVEGPSLVPALLIDGNRSGTYALFEHQAHQERLGGPASCVRCHHATLPLDRGTSCVHCHQDMYRTTDIFHHARHVRALGGNGSCVRCHADPAVPKTRVAGKPCAECHQGEQGRFNPGGTGADGIPGMAPGYRAAMHGLCLECHRDHEAEKQVEQPYLSRCHACHRDPSYTGEELRRREGWVLASKVSLP